MDFEYDFRKAKYRQLDRLATFGMDHSIGREAYDQLNDAIIIHWRSVWYSLQEVPKKLFRTLTGKCQMCGYRHIKTLNKEISKGYNMTCVYGWPQQLIFIVGAAMHGED